MRQLKSVEVYERLREEILAGALPAETRLVTRELSNRFGSSDIPIREALWMLAREGLVAMSPYAGARVAGLDRDAILEVLYIRGHLEGIATRLAVPGFDEGSLLALTEVVDRMDAEAAKTEPDPMAYSRLNHDFHQLIFERCPNNRLRDLINSLWEGHSNFQTVFRLNPHRLTASLDEHHAILDAIRAGDAVLAGRLARNHKGLQKQDLLAVLGDDENDTDIEVEG